MRQEFDYDTEEDRSVQRLRRDVADGKAESKRSGEKEVEIVDGSGEYSLLSEDPNIKRVVIDCEIISYAVNREGPGLVQKISNFCGCGQEDTKIHLDEILNNVKATFLPGEFVCLMGPSGAGKTTLLNILAARAGGFLIGNVKLNDRILEQKDMRMMMNYIPQDDVLFSALTPRETLTYTAKLRIANQTAQQRNALVNDLMDKLGITRCADVIVGNELQKGISGGQKKRTSVAMELVTNPSILFVDEATSGLDSQTAEDVVRILRDISRTGRTVICTIHQPSFDIFRMFDKLLLLQSGQVVYNGSVAESTKYFGTLGWACPEVLNPAEYFMRILTLERPLGYENEKPVYGDSMMVGRRVIHRKPIGPWANAWKAHTLKEEEAKIRSSKDMSAQNDLPTFPKKFDDDRFDDLDYPTGFMHQFMTLLERTMWMTIKDRQQFRARIILCSCVAIFTGLTYFNFSDDQETIQNRESVIFSSILFNGMNMLMNTVVLFPMERAVITREFQNGTYRMLAYYLSRIITSLIFQFVYVYFYVTILYFLSNMVPTAQEYLIYVFTVSMVGMIAVTLGLIIGALVPSIDLGPSLVTPMLMPLIVFSGYLIPRWAIKPWFIWIYYLSFFQYAFHILVVSQFDNFNFTCCCVNTSIYECTCYDPESLGLTCPPYCSCLINGTGTDGPLTSMNTTVAAGTCMLGQGCKTGTDFLDINSIGHGDVVHTNMIILSVFWAFLAVLGYVVMLWRGRKKTA